MPYALPRSVETRALHILGLALAPIIWATTAWSAPSMVSIGERSVIERHLVQSDIEAGAIPLLEVIDHGRQLFQARFNHLDGQGRPGSTGTGMPRTPDQPAFIRTSAPDANACSDCHNQPAIGGGGSFVANVFVLAQALDPVTDSVSPALSNERNSLGMFGAGAIEMLAREMSAELLAIRETARAEARSTGLPVTRRLAAKGVDFGHIRVLPNGLIDPTRIDGVDWDLIVKPFHQKGVVVSIREFTNNAMNHHHGMQSEERFGAGIDADLDGVTDELTTGDITAVTLFQASLAAPGFVPSKFPERRHAAGRGQRAFLRIGCGSCHVPYLDLDSRTFSEPNPFNPPGNLQATRVASTVRFDLATGMADGGVQATPNGGARVRAFTDLKRHDLNDADFQHFANEQIAQGSLVGLADPADFTVPPEPRPISAFLTRKLWDAGNSDPYGHRGDLTTLTEAIHFHGGAARAVRDRYFALSEADRNEIIEFLKSLQAPSS